MKKLEKLESFQLQNEKLVTVFGGEGGPVRSFLAGNVETTGGGSNQLNNYPSTGTCTCEEYTSDVWDGKDPRTMLYLGTTYSPSC